MSNNRNSLFFKKKMIHCNRATENRELEIKIGNFFQEIIISEKVRLQKFF